MPSVFRLAAASLLIAGLTACEAPPSVQKVIDEAEAREQAAKPKLDNPVLNVAREEGREVYMRYMLGKWAPENTCDSERMAWTFNEDSFDRPAALSNLTKPCSLAVVEALADGSYAIAGFCPRLELEDEPVVLPVTRIGTDQIIIPGVGGGALYKCG